MEYAQIQFIEKVILVTTISKQKSLNLSKTMDTCKCCSLQLRC